MLSLPIGLIVLSVASILILFGVAHRVLDRMQLSDRAAFGFVIAMIVGTFIPPIRLSSTLRVNIGGGIIPAILVVYLFVKASSGVERLRAVIAAAVSAVAVYVASAYLPAEPTRMIIDPIILDSIIAGVVGYLAGRSRRSAFIAGVMGIWLNDLVYGLSVARRIGSTVTLGGAGVYDATVIAGLLAVLLAEIVGETRERLQGGPHSLKNRPEGLKLENAINQKEEEAEEEHHEE